MGTVRSPRKTEVVTRIVISHQTAPSTCTCAEGKKTLHVLDVRFCDCLILPLLHLRHFLLQSLHDSDTLLGDDESCLALVSEAQSRQSQYDGLLADARPATTQSYIYIHKTEENGEIRHTFCYCLETDQWKELETGQGEGTSTFPDPPGSYLTSYAEKVHFQMVPNLFGL